MKIPPVFVLTGLILASCASLLPGQEEEEQAGEVALAGDDRLARFRPLIENSPFLSLEFKSGTDGARSGGLRKISFHGYVQMPKGWIFALRHADDPVPEWVRMNQTFHKFKIVSFDEENLQLTLTRAGYEEKLDLTLPK